MTKLNFIWTSDFIELLRQSWPTKSASQIANTFGCSRCAIIGKAHRLGLKKADGLTTGKVALSKRSHHKKTSTPNAIKNTAAGTIRIIPIPGVTLATVNDGQCRFPMSGLGHGGDLPLCGHNTADGAPYCSEHMAITHVAGSAKPMTTREKIAAEDVFRRVFGGHMFGHINAS